MPEQHLLTTSGRRDNSRERGELPEHHFERLWARFRQQCEDESSIWLNNAKHVGEAAKASHAQESLIPDQSISVPALRQCARQKSCSSMGCAASEILRT